MDEAPGTTGVLGASDGGRWGQRLRVSVLDGGVERHLGHAVLLFEVAREVSAVDDLLDRVGVEAVGEEVLAQRTHEAVAPAVDLELQYLARLRVLHQDAPDLPDGLPDAFGDGTLLRARCHVDLPAS